MKPTHLLIISSLMISLISSTSLKAETIIIKTGNGTKVESTSEGGVKISTPNRNVTSSEQTTVTEEKNVTNNSSSSSGTTCYQENVQTTTVNGSNRTVVRSNSSNCY